jgi:glycosyltransferase involved in cell wall biosynthesis
VVATRVGGTPELVEDGRSGFLVPPAQPAALAEVLGRYLAQPDLLGRQGEQGLARVRRGFSWNGCAAAYLGVYDELMSSVAGTRQSGVAGTSRLGPPQQG